MPRACGSASSAKRRTTPSVPSTEPAPAPIARLTRGGEMAEDSARVARGGSWLIEPVGASPQFTGADFTQDDVLYAKTAEDFVRNEVLTRLDEIEAKQEGLMPALLRRAGELGLLMIDVPTRFGGLGLRKTTSMLVSERG